MEAQGKWWDDGDTIRLYHGTSERVLGDILRDGLRPPTADIEGYALEILDEYIPRANWTDNLLGIVRQLAVNYRSRKYTVPIEDAERHTKTFGSVVYATCGYGAAASYAQGYARHGGEIACDVWNAACAILHPERSRSTLDPSVYLRPRWPDAKPVVIEFEIPKTEVVCDAAEGGLAAYAQRIRRAYESPAGERHRAKHASFEAFADSVLERKEFRIARTIRPVEFLRILDGRLEWHEHADVNCAPEPYLGAGPAR
jgi:hypothetical protein